MQAYEYFQSTSKKNDIYGILPFIAPEVLRGKPYTLASDIYSFSMIMWEFTSGIPPFDNRAHDLQLSISICKGERPEIIKNTPQCYVDLMKKCWNKNPLKRPSASEIREIIKDWISIIADIDTMKYDTMKYDTEKYDTKEYTEEYTEKYNTEEYNTEKYDTEKYTEEYTTVEFDTKEYNTKEYDTEEYDTKKYGIKEYVEYKNIIAIEFYKADKILKQKQKQTNTSDIINNKSHPQAYHTSRLFDFTKKLNETF